MSPMMSGSSEAAAQATTICGSESSNAFARSTSAVSDVICSRKEASASAACRRVRTSMMAVTTAKHRMPSVRPSAANSCRSSWRRREIEFEGRRARCAPACGGHSGDSSDKAGEESALAADWRGAAARLDSCLHTRCPKYRSDRPTAASARGPRRSTSLSSASAGESFDFTLKGKPAKEFQTVNDARAAAPDARDRSCETIQVERARARMRSVDADLAERGREGALGLRDGRKHHVPDHQALGRRSRASHSATARRPQDFVGGDALLLAPKLAHRSAYRG